MLSLLLCIAMLAGYVPTQVFAEDLYGAGLCEHHPEHNDCGYAAEIVGVACNHEHDADCYQTKCAHVHGECSYAAAVEGADCAHQHDNACGYAAPVAEIPCNCEPQETEDGIIHAKECAYAPAVPEGECTHIHGECGFAEAKAEIPCDHDCAQEDACNEKILNCTHIHDDTCGYVEAVEGKACGFVCEVCAGKEDDTGEEGDLAEETDAAAAAQVKALIDALPSLDVIQAKPMEEQQADYNQVQAAYGAYEALTESQKALLPAPEGVFKPYFDYFNNQIAEDEISSPNSGTFGDGLSWCFYLGTLTISGEGVMPNYISPSDQPWDDLRASIIAVVIEDGITAISEYAFHECENLTSITFGKNVASIGQNAFYGCNSLTTVIIPGHVVTIGNGAFAQCGNLITITLETGVKEIYPAAFYGCDVLTTVYLPASISYIGSNAFGSCTSLKDIYYAGDYDQWELLNGQGNAKVEGVTIHISPTGTCGEDIRWAFNEGTGVLTLSGTGATENYMNGTPTWTELTDRITEIVVEEGITELGVDIFENHKALKKVSLPSSLKVMSCAFIGCENLTELVIPYGVMDISGAFYGCTALQRITIPATVTEARQSTFSGCEALTDIYYGSSYTAWRYLECSRYVSATMHFTSAGVCGDNLTWDLEESTGILTISGTGDMIDYNFLVHDFKNRAPWYDYADQIQKVVVENGVTGIGEYAFYVKYGQLKSITLPDTLTRIGFSAFSVSGLTSITIPAGVREIGDSAFVNCRNLVSVKLSAGLETIGEYAFSGCSVLKDISIPNTVTSLGVEAFSYCTALPGIVIPDSVTSLGASVFRECTSLASVTLGTGLTVLSGGVFTSCSSLRSITIPSNITEIGSSFYRCSKLNTVILPDGLQTIGDYAFYECTHLENISIPASVTSIGNYAFSYCEAIKQITIPAGVTSIGRETFYDCGFSQITIPTSVISIGDYAFAGTKLTSVNVPASVTTLGEGVFRGCSSLTDVVLPGTMTEIPEEMFASCWQLPNITIPGTVMKIGEEAFSWCNNLRSITLPAGLQEIGMSAFAGSGLRSITFPENVELIDYEAFADCYDLRVLQFRGDAPVIYSDSFRDVTADAVYPRNNSTWTKSVLQNYGGTINWGIVDPPRIDDDLRDGKPRLLWNRIDGASQYQIYRATSENGAYTLMATTADTCFADNDAAVGRTYYYKVVTIFSDDTKATSRAISCKCILPAPVLFVECNADGLPVLRWNKVEEAVCYNIVRYEGDNEFHIVTAGNNYVDKNAVPGVVYHYQVQADHQNFEFSSKYSAPFRIKVPTEIPTITLRTDASSGKIKISWTALPDAKCYEVYRSTSQNGSYVRIQTTTSTSYTDTKAEAGKTYYYWVETICEDDSRVMSRTGSCLCVLPAPGVSVTNDSGGKPVVKWGKISGAEKYEVYRAAGNGAYQKVQTGTSVSYTDTAATVGTSYSYKVKAISSKGTYNSAYSAVKSCLAVCAQPVVTIKIDGTSGKPQLSWKSVTGAVGYEISRAESANGTFSVLAGSCKALSFTDNSAQPDKDYWYRVNAVGSRQELKSTNGAAQKIHTALAKPVVTFANDAKTGKPTLSWKAVDGAVEYVVYRSTSATKSYQAVKTTKELRYTDTSATVAKGYYYKVIAVGRNSNSAYSDYKKLTANCAQTEITVTADATSGKPVVKWNKVTGAKKYEVYRATSQNGSYTKVKTVTATSYKDTTAQVGTTYYYKVRAVASKSTYNGAYSAIKSCAAKCAQPVVTLKIDAASGKPQLSWKTITGAVGYKISRAESANGTFTVLAECRKELSFTDTSAKPEKAYWYKVCAVASNKAQNSVDSAVKMISATLAKPVVTFGVDSVSGKPSLTWKAVPGAVEYQIYRSTSATKSYKSVGTTTGLRYNDTSAAVGKGYYYKVIAIGANSKSAYSDYKKLTVNCAQAVISATADASSGKPVVSWSKVSGAKKYEVYRATAKNGTYTKMKTVTAVSYQDTTAQVGTTYYYKVRAVASKSTYNGVYSEIKSCTAKCAKPAVALKIDGTGKPVLSWSAVSGAVSYEIWRSENGGTYVRVASQKAAGYTDGSAVTDRKYSYKVKAVAANTALNSAETVTNTVTATCGAPVVSIQLNGNKPMVSWGTVQGAARYEVYRSTKSSSGFKKISTVTSAANYTDSSAKKGSTYYYKVVAVTAGGNAGAYSNVVKMKSK